jgi:hypothetical protein
MIISAEIVPIGNFVEYCRPITAHQIDKLYPVSRTAPKLIAAKTISYTILSSNMKHYLSNGAYNNALFAA